MFLDSTGTDKQMLSKNVQVTKRISALVAGLALATLLSGCEIGSPEEVEVHGNVHEYYKAMQAGNLEKAADYFSVKRNSHEGWVAFLEHAQASLGPVKSYKVKNVEVNTMLSGRLYTYDVSVQYEKAPAVEVLAMFNEISAEETQIISVNISADGYRPLGH